MQVPALPTDNLYKFLAVGGILIWLSGFYAYTMEDQEYHRNYREHRLELAEIRAKNLVVSKAAEAMRKISVICGSIDKPEGCEEFDESHPEFLLRSAKGLAEMEGSVWLAEAKGKILDDYQSSFLRAKRLFGATSVLGGGIAGLGFALWYLFLQRYQDARLKMLAEGGTEEAPEAEESATV